MDTILLITLGLLLITTLSILYLNTRSNPRLDSKEAEEIANLNAEIVRLKDSIVIAGSISLNEFFILTWVATAPNIKTTIPNEPTITKLLN